MNILSFYVIKRKERETQKSVKAKQTVDEMKEKDKEKRNYKKKVETEIQELADINNLKLKKVTLSAIK